MKNLKDQLKQEELALVTGGTSSKGILSTDNSFENDGIARDVCGTNCKPGCAPECYDGCSTSCYSSCAGQPSKGMIKKPGFT